MNRSITYERALILAALGGAALGISGCELLPAAFAGGGTPSGPSPTAELLVEIDHAEGTVFGEPLLTESLTADGFRDGELILLNVHTPQGTQLALSTGSSGSAQNPYGGGGGGPFPVDSGPFPIDAGPLPPDVDGGFLSNVVRRQPGSVVACAQDGRCQTTDQFGIDIAQLAEGRAVVVDGSWFGRDWVRFEMTYRELR